MFYRRWLCCCLLIGCVLSNGGCLSDYVAYRWVTPDNGGRTEPVNGKMAVPPLFDGAFAVAVGPPDAVMVCWVVEPWTYEIVRYDDRESRQTFVEAWSPAWESATIIGLVDDGDGGVLIGFPDKPPLGQLNSERAVRSLGEARGTIIMLQGWGGRVDHTPYLWPTAAALANAGYRVLMPDLRAQGLSSGGRIGLGVHEVRDLRQLLDEAERRGLVEGPVGVLGHSYGAGVAIMAAAEDDRIRAVVSLAPWYDCMESFAVSTRAYVAQGMPKTHRLFTWLLTDRTLERAARRSAELAGVNPMDASPAHAMRRTRTPILLIHGSTDMNCLVNWSQALYDARPVNTRFLIFDGADHWSFLFAGWQDVQTELLQWFEEQLGTGGLTRG